jgi:DNA-binding transcriptional MerR regulator
MKGLYLEEMTPEGKAFTAAQVVRITGVQYQTLNHWVKIGLVKASVSPAQGSGSRRLYDFQDLVAIRVAMKLHRAGIFGKAMVQILEVLQSAGFGSPTEVAIDVTRAGDVIVTSNAGLRFSARKCPGQLLLNWDCRGTAAELRRLIRDQNRERPASEQKTVASETRRFVTKRDDRERRA